MIHPLLSVVRKPHSEVDRNIPVFPSQDDCYFSSHSVSLLLTPAVTQAVDQQWEHL